MKLAFRTVLLCAFGLLALGMVMLYSSSMVQAGPRFLLLQLRCVGLGILLGSVAWFFDYRWLRQVAWPVLILSMVLLVLVFVPHVGTTSHGSTRWLNLGPASFQPSEPAKLGVIIFLAWYGEKYQKQMKRFLPGLFYPGVLVAIVLGLIFKEPDWGTTMLIGAISGILLLLAGTRWVTLVPLGIVAVCALGALLVTNEVRMKRVQSWLHPETSREGKGYQAWQAKIALGAGGTSGLGLGNGRQKLGFVPEDHTDFIFSIIGEELGLYATMGVLSAFVLFICGGVYIAWGASDIFGFLLAAGITFLIGLQAFINIAVVTSVLPNKGLPLPFISYGGSNLVFMLGSVGLLLSVARHAAKGSRSQTYAGETDLSPQAA